VSEEGRKELAWAGSCPEKNSWDTCSYGGRFLRPLRE
jgi:hypothetical protein